MPGDKYTYTRYRAIPPYVCSQIRDACPSLIYMFVRSEEDATTKPTEIIRNTRQRGHPGKDKPGSSMITTMVESKEEGDEMEMLRKIQFVNEGKCEEKQSAIIETRAGGYVTPYKVVIEGLFQDGMLHGEGSMHWPQGQRIDGTWNRGKLVEKRYIFADGLSYQEDGWNYCKSPDRRFYNCIINGLRPARKVLKTNTQPTKVITPFGYDTGAGIFDPDKKCITSYRNCRKILEIPTAEESAWIKENCRKGWSEPTGYRESLHKYWESSAAEFEALLPEDETENWWQRLTTFVRHSSGKTKTT